MHEKLKSKERHWRSGRTQFKWRLILVFSRGLNVQNQSRSVHLVYDVTWSETFTNLSDVWAKELELYSTNQDCIKMLVGNKLDRESERVITRDEGMGVAQELGSHFCKKEGIPCAE